MPIDHEKLARDRAALTADRPIFEFSEIRKSTCTNVHYDAVTATDADLSRIRSREQLRSRLHAWALDILTSGLYDIGLYHAACLDMDDDDLPKRTMAEVTIPWNGLSEVRDPRDW